MNRLNFRGIEIVYDDQGQGVSIILLHGFPFDRSMWREQIDFLSACGYRVIAPDLRGLGETKASGEISAMEDMARDVAALMDELKVERAVICGLSMGGYVAFAFLRKYPQRLKGLILADTRPGADNDEAKANREKVARIAETEGTGAIADLQIPNLITEETRRHHLEVEAFIRRMIDAATPQGIAAASRGMALRPDSTDMLANIHCPTLVIVGEHDVLTPPSVAQDYAAKIPGAQYIVIPSAGHLSNLEQPESFHQAISGFLYSVSW